MLPPDGARARVFAQAFRGKDVLPTPFCFGIGIFSRQSKRLINFAKTAPQILFVQFFCRFKLFLKRFDEFYR